MISMLSGVVIWCSPCQGQFTPGDARQFQDIVNKMRHFLRACAFLAEMIPATLVQLVIVIFQQCQTEAVDAAQRCAQIVGDGINGAGWT